MFVNIVQVSLTSKTFDKPICCSLQVSWLKLPVAADYVWLQGEPFRRFSADSGLSDTTWLAQS